MEEDEGPSLAFEGNKPPWTLDVVLWSRSVELNLALSVEDKPSHQTFLMDPGCGPEAPVVLGGVLQCPPESDAAEGLSVDECTVLMFEKWMVSPGSRGVRVFSLSPDEERPHPQ